MMPVDIPLRLPKRRKPKVKLRGDEPEEDPRRHPKSCPGCGEEELIATRSNDGAVITWRCTECTCWWRVRV